MSRLFDGVDDQMVYTVPGSGLNVNSTHTLLIVARVMVTADTTWLSFLETETSAAAASAALVRSGFNGNTAYSNGASLGDGGATTAITDSNGWLILAATKGAGTAIPRLHMSIVGGANAHVDAGSIMALPGSIAGGVIRIGGNDDFANIRVAAAAIFDKVLTDAEINGINTAKTTQSIYNLTPVWLVDDNDAFASDYMAHANRTSITGTADDADDPSGWVYGISGGAVDATVTAVPMDATGDVAVPTVSGDANGTVTAVPALALGDVAVPALAAGSTVVAVVMDAVADMAEGIPISGEVQVPGIVMTGDMAIPAVSGTTAGEVTAVPAVAVGDMGLPSVGQDQIVTAVPAVATGDVAVPAATSGSVVVAIPVAAVGDEMAAVLTSGQVIGAPIMLAQGDVVAPAIIIDGVPVGGNVLLTLALMGVGS